MIDARKGEETMYKKMYLLLFNRVTDALRELERGNADRARELLMTAQRDCEELYLRGGEDQLLP